MIKTITLCNICGKESECYSNTIRMPNEDEYRFDVCKTCNPYKIDEFVIPIKKYNCNEW